MQIVSEGRCRWKLCSRGEFTLAFRCLYCISIVVCSEFNFICSSNFRTKNYLHTLVFKLDDNTFEYLNDELSAFVSARNRFSMQDDNSRSNTDQLSVTPVERSNCSSRSSSSSSSTDSDSSAICAKNSESDGLSLFVRELRVARHRFKNGAVYWKRPTTVKGDRNITHVNRTKGCEVSGQNGATKRFYYL